MDLRCPWCTRPLDVAGQDRDGLVLLICLELCGLVVVDVDTEVPGLE